jgi:hypothetical protein
LTIHEKKPELYAFTEGQLYPITSVVANTLTINTEIIPFFSPADNTQIVMMDKQTDIIRIVEHFVEKNDGGLKQIFMKRILKIEDTEDGALAKRFRNRTVHTAVSTDMDKNFLLIDEKNIHIFDLESAIDVSERSQRQSLKV